MVKSDTIELTTLEEFRSEQQRENLAPAPNPLLSDEVSASAGQTPSDASREEELKRGESDPENALYQIRRLEANVKQQSLELEAEKVKVAADKTALEGDRHSIDAERKRIAKDKQKLRESQATDALKGRLAKTKKTESEAEMADSKAKKNASAALLIDARAEGLRVKAAEKRRASVAKARETSLKAKSRANKDAAATRLISAKAAAIEAKTERTRAETESIVSTATQMVAVNRDVQVFRRIAIGLAMACFSVDLGLTTFHNPSGVVLVGSSATFATLAVVGSLPKKPSGKMNLVGTRKP